MKKRIVALLVLLPSLAAGYIIGKLGGMVYTILAMLVIHIFLQFRVWLEIKKYFDDLEKRIKELEQNNFY